MEANEFTAKLKANDTEKDIRDLKKVFDEYKTILSKISAKDRGQFSLNVLSILCRNLDKAPSWCNHIDIPSLLTLSIECVRETRALERVDRVKTLACIYHLHRYVVKQNKPIPPELVLKISFMPFELESKLMLQEYYKTYFNILADRLTYIERLKTKVNIIKLLPKVTEDILKVVEIYDTIQFCINILVFIVKKLNFLYHETRAKELGQTFSLIFEQLSMKDMKVLKNLSETEKMEIYVKLNECLYVIAENAAKIHFKDCNLDVIVRTCISLVGHSPDLFHCLQMFYLNSFCSILKSNTNLSYTETILNSLIQSFETTEKLGYKKAMYATYPFLNQFLHLYVEYNVTNSSTRPWKQHFNVEIQENCLKLIQFFMKKLKTCEQLLKCENCQIKTGLHESLRILLFIKHFVAVSLSQKISITTILPIYYSIITEQYTVLSELNSLGCTNYEKCFRKLQTDVHNTAINLNKAQYYEYSIQLFDIYLKHELKWHNFDHKNISRALYNKSICELDCTLYENALIDAFLSLVFSQPEGLTMDKYMSLVMDIKAKELKSKSNEEEDVETDKMQLVSVLNACQMALDRKLYGDLEPFMSELTFSVLLKHEFAMYAQLWPSIAPIGGVWKSLFDLVDGNHEDWLAVEHEDTILEALYEVVLQTPSVVRTIHSEYFTTIVDELLDRFDNICILTPDLRLVHAALLFLRFEYDLAAASQKYGWKSTEPLQSADPDQVPSNRTIPQEYGATTRAIVAVNLLRDLSPRLPTVSASYLGPALQIFQIFVPLLLHLSRIAAGLQLAHICCLIADILGDDSSYLRNCGTLLYHCAVGGASGAGGAGGAGARAARAARACGTLAPSDEISIVFTCDAAIYHSRSGALRRAARLLLRAQGTLLAAFENNADVNLDLAVGRLLEAQSLLSGAAGAGAGAGSGAGAGAPTALCAVNAAQRHYLAAGASGCKYGPRRLRSASLRLHASLASLRAASLARSLRLARRARGAAAQALGGAGAGTRATLYAEIVQVDSTDDAQIKIDNRLKHLLGLQPSNESPPPCTPHQKLAPFTPKQDLETMLDNMVLKRTQTSPSVPCTSVPTFNLPDFLKHPSGCSCSGCTIPVCSILACRTSGLEAATYFRANEDEIARNYFDGVLKMFAIVENKLLEFRKRYNYEDFVVDAVMKIHDCEFKKVQLEVLIELSFFELKSKNYELADEYIVRIHEVMQEKGVANQYLSNEVMNLMAAAAQLKKVIRKPEEIDLEIEFENLKLGDLEPPMTPVTKPSKPPKPATKMIVKDEELPKKLKVMKLNLDDSGSDEKDFEKPKRLTRGAKRSEFKVPNPITSKPALEIATPRPTRSKPDITVTQPSVETPISINETKTQFYTPAENTPEQFFTPHTSLKTYSKKSLRHNIVKNLEAEFSTPKTAPKLDKENAVAKDTLKLPSKSLKRATRPGKLDKEPTDVKCKEKKETSNIPRRRRLHVKLSVDEEDKK